MSAIGLPELLVAIHTSRQSCDKAGEARIFTPVRESSGGIPDAGTPSLAASDRNLPRLVTINRNRI
jgi:hypothetical protein